MFERTHLQEIIKRMNEPRRFLQVLMGPRQVGKTTLISQLVEKLTIGYHFISADAVAATNSAWLVQQWEIARTIMDQEPVGEFLLVIDEIQKIDNWSEAVKLLWDTDTRNKRNLKVILLGSSRLLLQNGLTESLAGRFETTYMGHWSYEEMHLAGRTSGMVAFQNRFSPRKILLIGNGGLPWQDFLKLNPNTLF